MQEVKVHKIGNLPMSSIVNYRNESILEKKCARKDPSALKPKSSNITVIRNWLMEA